MSTKFEAIREDYMTTPVCALCKHYTGYPMNVCKVDGQAYTNMHRCEDGTATRSAIDAQIESVQVRHRPSML